MKKYIAPVLAVAAVGAVAAYAMTNKPNISANATDGTVVSTNAGGYVGKDDCGSCPKSKANKVDAGSF